MTEPETSEPSPVEPEAIEVVINCPRCGGRHKPSEEHAEYVPLPLGPRTVRNILRGGRVIS